MKSVLSLKAIALKYLVNWIWYVLDGKKHGDNYDLEKDWNLGLDSYSIQYKPFFGTELIASLEFGFLINKVLPVYKMKTFTILRYLKLSDNLKKDLVHVMHTQYNAKSLNIFHLLFMIEMGYQVFILKGYLHSPKYSSMLIDMLSNAGKLNVKTLHLTLRNFDDSDSMHGIIYMKSQVKKCLQTFTHIREFIDHCGFCGDNVLRILSQTLPHLEKLEIYFGNVTDHGISYLCSSESTKSKLYHLNLQDTLITSDGVLMILKHLPKIESLECVNPKSLMTALPSLNSRLEHVKNLSLSIAARTWTTNAERGLPFIFPLLQKFSYNFLPSDDAKYFTLVFLWSLHHLTSLDLLVYHTTLELKILTCSGDNEMQFQMHSVRRLRLYGFNNVCLAKILSIWPNLEFFTIANLTHSSCSHKNCENDLGRMVSHVNLISKTPMDYLACFPNMKTIALTIDDKIPSVLSDVRKLGHELTHVSLTCHDSLLQTIFDDWLVDCHQLQVVNLSRQGPNLEAVKRFCSSRKDVRVTFEDLYAIKPMPFELWFQEEMFSPCSLCQAYNYRSLKNSLTE